MGTGEGSLNMVVVGKNPLSCMSVLMGKNSLFCIEILAWEEEIFIEFSIVESLRQRLELQQRSKKGIIKGYIACKQEALSVNEIGIKCVNKKEIEKHKTWRTRYQVIGYI